MCGKRVTQNQFTAKNRNNEGDKNGDIFLFDALCILVFELLRKEKRQSGNGENIQRPRSFGYGYNF